MVMILPERVEELTEGKIKLTYGALYPVLHKLESEGFSLRNQKISITVSVSTISLTPKGHSVVAEKIKELNEFIESLQRIVEPKPGLSYA